MKKGLVTLCFISLITLSACNKSNLPEESLSGTSSVAESSEENQSMDIVEDNLEKSGFISSVGSEILNNGGNVVQYGDCVYFYGARNDSDYEEARWPVYVMQSNGGEKYVLYEACYPYKLFAISDYILITDYLCQRRLSVLSI